MNSSASKPSLPTWLFVVTDLALVAAAAVIALRSPQPLTTQAILAIVGCVSLGAIVGLVPLIARYERLKNEALDDRQRALETLSRTVHESAQQISIATGSLHELAELAQKNLRQAEHLPQKLQEKIAEFQAQLAEANDAEKAELEEELTALRTSESERLESISTKIAKSAAEWTKLEAATVQHLAAMNEAVAKLPAGAAASITQAQASADQALAAARAAAVKSLADSEAAATRTLAAAQAASLGALETKLTEAETRLAAATSTAAARAAGDLRTESAAAGQALDGKLAQLATLAVTLEAVAAKLQSAPAIAAPATLPAPGAPAQPAPADPVAATPTTPAELAPGEAPPTPAPGVASPPAPKRQRRTRREEAVPTNPPIAVPAVSPSTTEPIPEPPVPEPTAAAAPEQVPPIVEASALPTEVPSESAPAVDPSSASNETQHPFAIPAQPAEPPLSELPPGFDDTPPPFPLPSRADATQHPFHLRPKGQPATPEKVEAVPEPAEPAPPSVPPGPEPVAADAADDEVEESTDAPEGAAATPPTPEEPATPAPVRKRAPRKFEPAPEPSLDLPFEEPASASQPGHIERTLTSDGAMRLLATAYIGIGNRLYIRGDGPGLSWERGVPLQFVSIGKWRWETNDASGPVRFKLYKNDDQECTALGEQILEPGHLQEMQAAF